MHSTVPRDDPQLLRQAATFAQQFQGYRGQPSPPLFSKNPDAVGRPGQIDLALPCLRPGGTVGIYGIDEYGRCPINPQRARGTFTFYNGGYDEEETHERVIAFWQRGLLRAEHWLDLERPFPLTEISQALAAVRERRLVKALVRLAS